jgi:hypothetical protein
MLRPNRELLREFLRDLVAATTKSSETAAAMMDRPPTDDIFIPVGPKSAP